jgi:hypothetical protein
VATDVHKGSSRILLEEKIYPKIEANRKAVCDWFAEGPSIRVMVLPVLFLMEFSSIIQDILVKERGVGDNAKIAAETRTS